MKKAKKKFCMIKAVAAAKRKSHFESGGDLASWRGRSTVFSDRKKSKLKKICRKKVKEEYGE